jgi:3-hydroxyacyl-[acyl-carrier-protein] dehydratase
VRFELIDQVLEQHTDRIRALKNVSVAEEYLADHFPGFAVLPGVMMLETLVQAGRQLLASQDQPGPWILAEARNVRYGNMVRPGQALVVEVTLRNRNEHAFDLQGVGTVGDQVAVQARFSLAHIPPRPSPAQTQTTNAIGVKHDHDR